MTVKLLNPLDMWSCVAGYVSVYWALWDVLAAVLAQRRSHEFNINIRLMMKTLCNLLLRGDTPRVYCRGGEQQELWRRFTSPRIDRQDSQTWLCSTVMFTDLPNKNFKAYWRPLTLSNGMKANTLCINVQFNLSLHIKTGLNMITILKKNTPLHLLHTKYSAPFITCRVSFFVQDYFYFWNNK